MCPKFKNIAIISSTIEIKQLVKIIKQFKITIIRRLYIYNI